MANIYGVTAQGFNKPTLSQLLLDRQSRYLAAFGPTCNFLAPSNMATVIGIDCEQLSEAWDGLEECWNSRGRSTSQGVSLDNANELTNTLRLAAAPSKTFLQYFFGVPGTVVPGNDTTNPLIVSVQGNALAQFSPLLSTPLVAGASETQSITFSAIPDGGTFTVEMSDGQITPALGDASTAAEVQAAINALTAVRNWSGVVIGGAFPNFTLAHSGPSGLQPQALVEIVSDLVLGMAPVTVIVAETLPGVPQGQATMVANAPGAQIANAFTLTNIVTPISGLTGTLNADDATVGRAVESDAAYRIRADADVQASATTTPEAIRAALLATPNVLQAVVYQNTTNEVDGNGVPPGAVHCFVYGGSDADIGATLWKEVGGGIGTFGAIEVDVLDSQGLTQTVFFDRPTPVPIYGTVVITKGNNYPTNGNALVLQAILAYGAALGVAAPVLLRPALIPAIAGACPGIEDMNVAIGIAPAPTQHANIPTTLSELATFSSANWSVTSV